MAKLLSVSRRGQDRPARGAASPGKADAPVFDAADDAALFLNAVSAACPLRSEAERSSRAANLLDDFSPDTGVAAVARPCPGANGGRKPQEGDPARTAAQARSRVPGAAVSVMRPERAPEAAREEDDLLFAKSMQGVSPLPRKGREVAPAAGKGRILPPADPAGALRDLLEGRLEFALYHSDEYMEGHVVGIDPLVLARLRAGQFSPEAHLDLHGQNAAQARDSLTWFIKNAYLRGLRTVLVVTGRGRNSPDGVGVLRPLLPRWLSRDPFKRVVLAFCTAKAGDGGPGAIYTLLRKHKKSRGKIIWEHGPSDGEFPDL